MLFWPIQIRTVQLYYFQSDSEAEQSKLENIIKNRLIDEVAETNIWNTGCDIVYLSNIRLASFLYIPFWLPRYQGIFGIKRWLMLSHHQQFGPCWSECCTPQGGNFKLRQEESKYSKKKTLLNKLSLVDYIVLLNDSLCFLKNKISYLEKFYYLLQILLAINNLDKKNSKYEK